MCSMYRLDYDVAVGVSGHKAKEAALCETTEPTEPMPYDNSDQFAVWCKTLLNPVIDWKVAAALAAARMTGRVWTWVHATDELRPGDHVAFNSGKVYYYQHAIVSHVQGMFFGAHPSPPQLSYRVATNPENMENLEYSGISLNMENSGNFAQVCSQMARVEIRTCDLKVTSSIL